MRKFRRRNFGAETTQVVGTPEIIDISSITTAPTPLPAANFSDFLNVQVTPDQQVQLQNLSQAIPQVQYVKYIVVGDEPAASVMTVDLSKNMSAASYNALADNLRYMPRAQLPGFMSKYILISVDPQYSDIIRKAVINLFNTVNLSEINLRQIDPWQWEQIKTEAYEGLTPVVNLNESYAQLLNPLPPAYDAAKEQALVIRYGNLPKIADLNLEIQRQAAILGLLAQAEYDAVDQLITQYEQASPEVTQLLTDPVALANIMKSQTASDIAASIT